MKAYCIGDKIDLYYPNCSAKITKVVLTRTGYPHYDMTDGIIPDVAAGIWTMLMVSTCGCYKQQLKINCRSPEVMGTRIGTNDVKVEDVC